MVATLANQVAKYSKTMAVRKSKALKRALTRETRLVVTKDIRKEGTERAELNHINLLLTEMNKKYDKIQCDCGQKVFQDWEHC